MPPLFFLKRLMPALWQVPHIPLPMVAHVLNLTASCPWGANGDSLRRLHECHFWDAELTECFVSCYFCLSPCLFIWCLTLWTHFAFWFLPVLPFFNFIFIFSVLSFLTEWRSGVLHWPAMPIQGKALLPSLKERVQHCTLDLCKSHNSDACLGGPSGGLKGFIWINCEILFISVV